MQTQEKRPTLEAQVQSLKEIIKTLEATNPDEVARKWRAKVFEELMRNKQQQLAHATELRRAQDDTRRVQSKAEEMLLALQKCQSSLTAITQENAALQQRLIAERQERAVLVNIQKQQQALLLAFPQHLQGQFEVMAEMLNKLEKYEQKISVCQSQVRAARIIIERERVGANKALRELKTDNERLRTQTYQTVAVIAENETLKRHLAEMQNTSQQLAREKSDLVAEGKTKIEEKNVELTRAREVWESQKASLEDKLKDVQFAQETAQGEIVMLKTSLEAALLANAAKASESEILKSRISSLEAAFSALKSEHESAQHHLSSDFANRMESEQRRFESALVMLRAELTAKDDDFAVMRSDFESEKDDLLATIASLERTLKEMKRDRGLLLSSLKTQERRLPVPTASKEVQTVTEVARSTLPAARPVQRIDDLYAVCRDLLDAP